MGYSLYINIYKYTYKMSDKWAKHSKPEKDQRSNINPLKVNVALI